VEKHEPLFSIAIGSFQAHITTSILAQWIIIIVLAILAKILTSNLKKVPDKRQSALEIIYEAIVNLVKDNMGKEYVSFIPYVGTLAIFILLMNLTPLVAVEAPTSDLSVAVGLALISFVVVQYNAIKKVGIKHYLTAFTEPVLPLLPLNIIERIVLPVSLSLRLFGNMTAGAVVLSMVYAGLSHLAVFAQLAIPVPLHFFFDIFDGSIQMIVFVMLTMMNIKIVAEH
jgi:F-type H+-transporting ATPase subunit a